MIGIKLERNSGIGLRVGNYCADSLTVLNASSSISYNGRQGIELLSCYGDATGQ